MSEKQPSLLPWGCWVEPEPHAVGDNMMMEPAERGEIVGIVISGLHPMPHMMGLQPVPAVTSVDGAATITPADKPAKSWRNCPGRVRCCHRFPLGEPDQLNPPAAQDAFQYVWPNLWTELDLCSGFAAGPSDEVAIDQHRHQRFAAIGWFTVRSG